MAVTYPTKQCPQPREHGTHPFRWGPIYDQTDYTCPGVPGAVTPLPHTSSRKDGGGALGKMNHVAGCACPEHAPADAAQQNLADNAEVNVISEIRRARTQAVQTNEYRTIHIHIDKQGRIIAAGIADGISDRGGPAACFNCQD